MGLICRSCRQEVIPGDIICPTCRANLTGGDAVVDSAEVRAEVPTEASAEASAEEPAARPCPHCGHELPDGEEHLCPACLQPLGRALVVQLETSSGGRWRHVVLPGGSLLLGRDPRQSPAAAVLATFDVVSRRHAQVCMDSGGQATVADLGSTNGTFVDDEPVRDGVAAPLRPGSRLRLGSSVSLTVEEA